MKSMFGRVGLVTGALGAFLMLAGVQGAKANDWRDSNRRVTSGDWRSHESDQGFRYYSPEARYGPKRQDAYEQSEQYRNEWREQQRPEWSERGSRDYYRGDDDRRYSSDRDRNYRRDRDRD